jgi:hypothetical protein
VKEARVRPPQGSHDPDPGGYDGYARNETVFLYDVAGKVLAQICLEPILGDVGRHEQFLALVDELLAWTFQEIVPPFAKSKRDHDGHTAVRMDVRLLFMVRQALRASDARRGEEPHHLADMGANVDSALLMLRSVMRSL